MLFSLHVVVTSAGHTGAMKMTIAFLAAALLACMSLFAADERVDEAGGKIAEILRTRFPSVQIEAVKPSSDLPGFYEVITQTGIVYADANAERLINGAVLDTRTQRNLTAQRWAELNAIDFQALPLGLAIKTVKGDGRRRLAVFSDPDCPYCRDLERTLQDIPDVTIYTFMFPLDSIHPEARAKAAKIWCAQDRAAAWSQWMLQGVVPQGDACQDDSVAKAIALGETLKVNSTPTLFLADGRRVEGALAREQLEQQLNSVPSAP